MRRSIREMGKEIKDYRDSVLSQAPSGLLESLEVAIDMMISPTPDIYLEKDGDSYYATLEDFINLQESPAGFGDTPGEAFTELYDQVDEEMGEYNDNTRK